MSNGNDIPGPEQQSRAKNDDDAGIEAVLIASGRMEDAARRREYQRRERLLDVLSYGRIILARVLIAAAILFIGVMGWHYFGPEKWAWMSSEQIDRAETAIAGSAVSLIILFLRRYL